jgi:predicted amidohydrolase YtcJ
MTKSYSVLSRRALLRTGGAAFALTPLLAGLPQVAMAQATGPADRIFTGGAVLTMEDALPVAEALAVKDGLILAVGTEAEIMALAGPDTVVTDLGGRALIPGFFDAHGHVTMGGLQALSANLLAPPDGEVTDIASLQETLRTWIAANAEAVAAVNLIVGFGYEPAELTEQRHPTRHDLDAVSMDVPIVCVHQSAHLAALNSAALAAVGIGPDTPDPVGGVIRREADGVTPDGVLEEMAMAPALVTLLSGIGESGGRAFVEAGTKLWARYGYTSAEEGRATPGTYSLLKSAADEGKLPIDVVVYADVLVDRDFIAATQSPDYVNRLRLGGAKLTIDGSPQGFTALRDRPYYDPVGNYPPGYLGYAAAPTETFVEVVDWSYANGVQIITHANGEGAIDILMAAHETAQAKHAVTGRRDVLIHGQFMREDQVDRCNTLGILPSLFPMHTFYWGDWHREHTVGPARADDISPTGWVMARGMRWSTHHDAPVAFPDSMRVLDATVTRRTRSGDILGPAHRVPVMTALKAMTIWPAWHHFEDDRKGSLAPGKLADLVILSADPLAVDPETLDQMKVVETIKDGVTVFDAAADQGALHYVPLPDGSDPYADTLRLMALSVDMGAGGGGRFASLAALRNGPHATGCVSQRLDDILAAAVAQG